MATPKTSKMSLVAQFDDLCRYSNVLMEGCEPEFKSFVMRQKQLFLKFKETEAEIQGLKDTIHTIKKEKNKVEACMTQTKSLLASEISKRKKLELEKASMERQIALIKEVLMKDGTTIDNDLRHFLLTSTSCQPVDTQTKPKSIEESVESLLSPSDIDETDEDLDNAGRRSKRRSVSNRKSSNDAKRQRSDGKKKEVDFIEYMDTDDPPVSNVCVIKRRSHSEPHAPFTDMPPVEIKTMHRSDSDQVKSSTIDTRFRFPRSQSGTPIGRYSTGGKLSRMHAFATKTVIRQEKCYACGRIIKFCNKALKCSDCRLVCHPECKEQCPLPCVPLTRRTPTKAETGTISDYVSSSPPLIPPLIVLCVNEIELRGMKEIGLYRVSGSERHVKDLREKLLKGNVSTLNQCDIHAVCGTVKEFLRSLKDSLITQKAWQTFVEAADDKNMEMSLSRLYDAVLELPQPNQDTLAFLVLHFQKIAKSPECRMPIQSLAKVLGPTVVGYSTSIPSQTNMLTETAQQCEVMERLLTISSELWESILNLDLPEVFNSPINLHSVSRLGPIIEQKATIKIGRTSLTPRKAKAGRKPYLSPF